MGMKKPDKDLRVHVLDELDWAPNVDADDGTVTLKGTIQSWTDFEDIEKAVWAAPGVTKVKNNLRVKREAYAY